MKRQQVLIIDDSPDIHQLLRVRLRPENVDLLHAENGEDGVESAVTLQPDLVLLDVDMPGVTGFDVCQRLKSDPRTSEIPVIFLTAAGEVLAKVQGFDLGAVDYVTKPFEPAELRARVRSALRMKRFQDLLAAKAQLDGLTGLWNRAYFDRRLLDEVQATARYGRTVSLVMLDIDHFKKLNDDFGHPFGDVVLQRVGELLAAALRASDAACRYGGEEFACILTETSLEGALIAGERIRDQLRGLDFVQKGRVVPVTASIGVSSTELIGVASPSIGGALVESADRALYEAKRSGRDRVCTGTAAHAAE
jgi:two-component system, cell cycle response regulator